MGWIFSRFTKKVKKARRYASKDIDQKINKIDTRLYKRINQAAERLDHIAQERISHTRAEAEALKTNIKDDIEKILNNTNEKVTQQIQEIERIRRQTIEDFEKSSKHIIKDAINEADYFVENRINQLALSLMETTESKLYGLEQQVSQDIHDVINHLEFVVDKTLEQVRNELKKNIGHAIPRPFFDQCRKELNLRWKPGALFSDIELYRLSECYELKKLNEETPVEKIREVYGQLQLNAARMFILAEGASGLQQLVMEDWLKYGMLCDFWHTLSQRYDSLDLEQLRAESKQTYLLKHEE